MRTFYLVISNTLISVIVATLVWFSVGIWVYLQTRSVLVTSILSGGYMIAVLFSGVIFGALVDKFKKKHAMITADAISMIFFLIGFLIYYFTPQSEFSNTTSPILWIFLIIIFAGVIVSNIRAIAVSTATTFLVSSEKRDRANGITGTATGASYLIAPLLGGALLEISGMFYILILAVILRLITITQMLFITINEDRPTHAFSMKKDFDVKGTFLAIRAIPGLLALLLFNSLNNFLSGVFMPLIDPYGLSLVDQRSWGIMSGILSIGFIFGGLFIAKRGLGKNPVHTMFLANILIWTICIFFAIQPSILLLGIGMFLFFASIPFIEACEQTIIQKLVAKEKQGSVFGFAQSIESAATPFSALAVGPIAQFLFIPFMTTGAGVVLLGDWFGIGEGRGIGLLFTLAGICGLLFTLIAMRTKYYRIISNKYLNSTES